MKVTPSKNVQNIEASPTLVLVSKAKELMRQGKDVISLSVGEPDWPTMDVAKKAGIESIEQNFTKYTPATGILPLREAIAQQVNDDFGTQYQPENVATATGGKFVIYSLLYSLLNSGDEVLIPSPYWVSYPSIVQLCGATSKIITTSEQNQFKLTPDLLEKAIGPKTRLLLLNSPSNPTGFLYTQEELNELAKVIVKHPQLLVMSDDIYNRLSFDHKVAPHLLQSGQDLSSQLFIVNGVSKTYSMTGWRIGWAVGDSAIMSAMGKLQSQTTSSACSVSQKAALAAIQHGEPELKTCIELLRQRRDHVFPLLNHLPGVNVLKPDGAFYMWTNVSGCFGKSYKGQPIQCSQDFAQLLLENYSVVVVPGEPFGQDGYIRISYALQKERMNEAVDRMAKFIDELV